MKKPLLFYIDDDANDILLFEDACREAGASFHLKTANDGEAAMKFLEETFESNSSSTERPVLVLLDIKMPRLSGFEILEWIRRRMKLNTLPVVIFTSSKHEVDIRRAYEAGASSYLVKTVDFSELIQMVKILDEYWIRMNQTVLGNR
jgi:CheY-like chemotaxis protein